MIEQKMPKSWLVCRNLEEWHTWLKDHHETETEIWLQIKKVKSKEEGIFLSEAVEDRKSVV